MWTAARLALRPHRFALVWVALLCIAAGGVALAMSVWLSRFSGPAECLDLGIRYTQPCAGFAQGLEFDHEWAARVLAFLPVLPVVAGVVLGVPLVASEVEARTATLAWWLEPSRRRWLLTRTAVFGTVLALLLALPAIAGDVLERERIPRYDPATTVFLDYGSRGAVLVGRGIAIFSLAVLVGLVAGRVLPGLIAAAVAAVIVLAVLEGARWFALPVSEPVVAQADRYVLDVTGQQGIPNTFRDQHGTLYTVDQILALAPARIGTPTFNAWYDAQGFTQARYGVSGERLGIIEVRELIGLGLGTVTLVGAATWAVGSRRPY